ncbi:MAG: HAMP domain-containing protein [Candidatus Eisenbacteria bacterium]|nr:HAMP domain-containing protein [Candidatus Eisenbacteria bacterium]
MWLPWFGRISGGPALDGGFLRSRVARRVFSLFVLCALVPLVSMSWLTYREFRSELSQQADRRMHAIAKGSGMSLIEDLKYLEHDLNLLAEQSTSFEPGAFTQALGALPTRFEERFVGYTLLDAAGVARLHHGRVDPGLTLSVEQRGHLAGQPRLLLTRPRTDTYADVLIAVPLPHLDGATLVGTVRPQVLWNSDDIRLAGLETAVVESSGRVIFSTDPARKLFEGLIAQRALTPANGRFDWSSSQGSYLAGYWTLFLRGTFGAEWVIVQSQPKADIYLPLRRFSRSFALAVALTLFSILLVSLVQIRRQLVPIESLREAADAMAEGKLEHRVTIRTRDEFADLGAAWNHMAASLQHSFAVMRASNEVGISLTAQQDVPRLLEMVAKGAQRIVQVDGVAIYVKGADDRLLLSVLTVASRGMHEVFSPASPAPFPTLSLTEAADLADAGITHRAGTGRNEDLADGLEHLRARLSYEPRAWLTVPLRDHELETIGVLQLINPVSRSEGGDAGFTHSDRDAAASLASQAAVALNKSRLLESFKSMFEGLTNLIATAIDEKSPYTGAHCQRVPILTMMLAEAACATRSGPLAGFSLSDEEMYELKIAALLHDCGKVTTPVHVVDKATKLETIFDRIELIATRCALVRAEREAVMLSRVAAMARLEGAEIATPERVGELRTEHDTWCDQLEQDLAFLRQVNLGGEYMPPESQARVRAIAERYRMSRTDGPPQPLLTGEEIENLCISRGTLNATEREIINSHVVATIRMLEMLPYPKNLANVPFLAGAHHEKLNGTGYPEGLTAEHLPLRARIIGLADIFEALTAADRPYKAAMPLSQAIGILRGMAGRGEIDPDLLDLFVRERLHLRYAAEYLRPEQNDLESPEVPPGEVSDRKAA